MNVDGSRIWHGNNFWCCCQAFFHTLIARAFQSRMVEHFHVLNGRNDDTDPHVYKIALSLEVAVNESKEIELDASYVDRVSSDAITACFDEHWRAA